MSRSLKSRLTAFWLIPMLIGLCFITTSFAQETDWGNIDEICSQTCQKTDAPWRSIPWETDLIEAQHKAVETGKPLFVWAMDGHPLGCT
jgi:hypothetical protein